MDSEWILVVSGGGFWMDSEWIPVVDSEWILNGFRLDFEWILNGLWLDSEWILTEFWIESQWILAGYWILTGFFSDYDWILLGFWMDSDWILHRISWDSMDSEWILNGNRWIPASGDMRHVARYGGVARSVDLNMDPASTHFLKTRMQKEPWWNWDWKPKVPKTHDGIAFWK